MPRLFRLTIICLALAAWPAVTALCLSTLGRMGAAAEPSRQNRKGPLAALPSPAGETIARLKTLGNNEWLNLAQAASDRQWGLARGRAWTPKMAHAPDLGGAFFCGTGQHGYVKPDGHYMDDLWFYDAELNVHFFYMAGDSITDDATMLAYRYQRKP